MKIVLMTVCLLTAGILYGFGSFDSENSISVKGQGMSLFQLHAEGNGYGIPENKASEDSEGKQKGTDGNEGQGKGNNDDATPPTADELSSTWMMLIGLAAVMISYKLFFSRPQQLT
jgi:hypothetical protein